MTRSDGTFDSPRSHRHDEDELGITDYRRDLGIDSWPDAPDRPEDAAPSVIDLDAPRGPQNSDAASWTPSWQSDVSAQPETTQTYTFDQPVTPEPGVPAEQTEQTEQAEQIEQDEQAERRRVTSHRSPEPVPPPPTWNIPPVPTASKLGGAESLTAATVLRRRRPPPRSGFRKFVYRLTGHKVNLGLSRADRRQDALISAARTPVVGCHRLAVISLKGGVGKTTTTAALGTVFAELRGDRVIALDANPDRGTLGERVPRESGATVRHLLEVRDHLHRYADVRAFTSQSPTRLEVLASDADPSASLAFSEQDYRDTVATLERFYNLILTDCGTGLLHDAMRGVLGLAGSLIVVSSASLDGARSASATLDWLEAHGFDELARNAVVVISSVRPGGGIVDLMQLHDHFASRCRRVVTVPYDPHLEAGGVLELGELEEETRAAYYELAAAVGEGFPESSRVSD